MLRALADPGARLVVLPNHFKSKRGGNSSADNERRKKQGERAHTIASAALSRTPLVLVAGDLNDTPDSGALQELLKDGFADVQSHPSYPTDRPGTFATGTASNKIDYLILSPDLRTALHATGIERRGTYHPQLWTSFPACITARKRQIITASGPTSTCKAAEDAPPPRDGSAALPYHPAACR
jgi:hypothetical protein